MTKFDTCLTSLDLRASVPVDVLRTTAAGYRGKGIAPDVAMLRAVEDQLALAQREKQSIMEVVAAQYAARGAKPGALEQTKTPAFKKWFGDSKVLNDAGEPRVVYHGTNKSFDEFRTSRIGRTYWFAEKTDMANGFTPGWRGRFGQRPGNGANVLPVFLSIKNPVDLRGKFPQDQRRLTMASMIGQLQIPEADAILAAVRDQADVDQVRTMHDMLEEAALLDALKAAGYDGYRWDDAYSYKGVEKQGTKNIQVEGESDSWAAFEPGQIKSATGNSGAFDSSNPSILRDISRPRGKNGARDLLIHHNLTAANLLHADRMGGIAVPSLAVVKKDSPLTGFGEITLIGSRAMADPKGYAKTQVFGADIYSPRYPTVEHELDKAGQRAFTKKFEPMAERLGSGLPDTQDIERKGVEAVERSLAVMAQFVAEQGMEPAITMRAGTMDTKRVERLKSFGLGPYLDKTSIFDLTEDADFVRLATDEMVDTYRATGDERMSKLADRLLADQAAQKNHARDLGYKIISDAKLRQRPEADKYATQTAIEKQIADAGLAEQYQQYAADQMAAMSKSERIFKGFSNSGKRTYTPHTLENVVKILKKELRGGENFNYGVGSLRAKFTPQFKSVADIQKEKGRLVTAEQFEEVRKEIDAEFMAVGNAMGENLNMDTVIAILEDAPRMGLERAAAQYKIELTDDAKQKAVQFLDRLHHLPTAYFEAKILRDVSLAEFAGAVIPHDTPQKVRDVLARNGVKVIEYQGDEKARAAAIEQFAGQLDEEKGDVLFDLTDQRTIEVDGERRPIRYSNGELVAPDFAGQVKFWQDYQGPVDDRGRPVAPDEARDLSELTLLMTGRPDPVEAPKRVATLAKLKAAQRRLDTGEITEGDFRLRVEQIIGALEDRNASKVPKPRERGTAWLMERLMRARRTGELDPATVNFALWALGKNPSIAEDLGISIRAQGETGTAGMYNPVSRVTSLFKGAENPGTAVHEILHHTERMMPPAVQEQIVKAWRRAFAKAHTAADEKTRGALNDMFVMANDKQAAERVLKAFRDGVLDYDTHYQLSNASEFWAVNATRLMASRFEAGSWLAKAKTWLAELAQKMRGWLGLPSDAAVLKGLQAVLDGTGAQLSPRMLVDQAMVRDITDDARPWLRPAALEWERGTDNSLSAALPDGSTLFIYSDEDGTTLNRFDEDGTEMRAEQEHADIDAAKEAGQAEYNTLFSSNAMLRDITRTPPTSTWTDPELTGLEAVIHTLQDKHIDMKRTVAAVRTVVTDLEDKWDPYLQEELFHGRSATGFKTFLNGELRPLLVEMQARGVTVEEFEEFLHMRHAEEANEQIARINPEMPDGGSGVDTADAQNYLAGLAPAKLAAYTALATRVDAMTAQTQALLVDYGLEKQSTIDAWNATYQNYVPLMREDMEAGQMGNGTGQGFSIKGSASKRRMGSGRKVINILANVAMARERAVVRGEKNRLDLALYGLALQAPNPDFWRPINPKKNPAALEAELIAMGLTPAHAAAIVDEPKQRVIDKQTGLVVKRTNTMLRSAPNVLAVRVGGEDRFIFFNEKNDRAIRMVSSLKNMGGDNLTKFFNVVGMGTRWFASVNTQYNPVFGLTNFTRDISEGAINLASTPIAGKQGAFMLEAGRLFGVAARHGFRLERLTGADLAMWEEFQNEGGITGYRAMFSTSDERAKELGTELRRMSEGKAKKAGRAVLDWLSDYNEALENVTRMAAYKVAKEGGMSNQQAASLAKNLTVNFNRKGNVGTQVNSLFAFFNAAVQGMARMAQTLNGPAGKTIIGGGLLLGVMQAAMMAAAGFGDDEPPEFVKERNFIIPLGVITGGKKYLSIPYPLGYSFIPTIGRIGTELTISGGKKVGKHITNLASALLGTFSPLGSGNPAQIITPTVGDPLVDLWGNRDGLGREIARQDLNSLRKTPGHTRTKDTASAVSKALSYYINAATGGNAYTPGIASPTPDQIDYLIGQLTGGVGRELLKAQQTVSAGISGEDMPAHKIPLVGRFYGDAADKSAVSKTFYGHLETLNQAEQEWEGRREEKDGAKEYLAAHPEVKMADQAQAVQREIAALRKRKTQALEKNDRVRVMDIELRIRSRMEKFNAAMEARQEKAPATP